MTYHFEFISIRFYAISSYCGLHLCLKRGDDDSTLWLFNVVFAMLWVGQKPLYTRTLTQNKHVIFYLLDFVFTFKKIWWAPVSVQSTTQPNTTLNKNPFKNIIFNKFARINRVISKTFYSFRFIAHLICVVRWNLKRLYLIWPGFFLLWLMCMENFMEKNAISDNKAKTNRLYIVYVYSIGTAI